ncbi:NADP-dependent oxidoreductase domain-containing protein [Caenorhabditis elegans]|uniref:NADP-dependent oxidoreductase domain-containing protein n=1 Tax=Caenorhabditis elegans TaxID=6239 RepID=Q22352_CAEEL|nr:NADP-dependent oxidoreductase domain-containing protein [Caenorhabditis elegans]CCD72269.1 NADP-dependent oxidoreductase domain-containing protein [Caenorhabditis elegans]|eukprot:NP_504231.1 Uncharacterized protein CELE_T08H10.1 [Caenorhabditis elegans]
MTVDSIPLNTGAQLPLFGLGTWQVKDEAELTVALRAALDAGYRLIDTAHLYQNEHIIGKVLHEYISSGKLKREDIFVTSKLPFTAHAPEDVPKCVESQLKALQLEYIDLYLIHCPFPFKHQEGSFAPLMENGELAVTEIAHIDTWRALEKLYKEGKLKALGVSNFSCNQLQALYDAAEVKPANQQVECHIYWPQQELRALCKKLGVTVTAYAPLGSPGRKAARPDGVWPEGDPLLEPIVKQLAAKYHKTAAQILIRHLTQHGISTIPKSVSPDRIVENISTFDFKLSDEDMHTLNSIETRTRLFIADFAVKHPFFPHDDIDTSKVPKVGIRLH